MQVVESLYTSRADVVAIAVASSYVVGPSGPTLTCRDPNLPFRKLGEFDSTISNACSSLPSSDACIGIGPFQTNGTNIWPGIRGASFSPSLEDLTRASSDAAFFLSKFSAVDLFREGRRDAREFLKGRGFPVEARNQDVSE